MPTIQIDSSDLKRLIRQLDRVQAKLPQAIARGVNEGGDKVRTQVQRALQQQSGLVRYSSVTKRTRTARAYATGMDAKSGIGPPRPSSMSYMIIVSPYPATKPNEFRTRVTKGRGGGVTVWLWGKAHQFKRSFQSAWIAGGGLRMRLEAVRKDGPGKRGGVTARLPLRGFDGPNLAKEAVKGAAARTFHDTAASVVAPIVEKHMQRALK
jgi:hypothetical protein